jgi:hypothetical protein
VVVAVLEVVAAVLEVVAVAVDVLGVDVELAVELLPVVELLLPQPATSAAQSNATSAVDVRLRFILVPLGSRNARWLDY